MDFRSLAEFAYSRVLPWAAPPLLGAAIGYITNDIAIRMLFRPLTEKRLFGVRLPFTPGIIPKQRYELAESIARMVSRELITAEAVRGQMASPGFGEKLERNLQALLGDLLDKPLAALAVPGSESLLASLERFLADALAGFLSSRSFIHGVRTLVAGGVHRLSGLTLGELLRGGSPVRRPVGRASPRRAGLGPLLGDRLLPLLSSPESRRRIARGVQRWLEERKQKDEPLGGLLPPELLQALGGLAGLLVPALLEALFHWLEEAGTRSELALRGTSLLREILDKLNVLQKFLVTAGQFDRRLEQKMPEIIDDTLRSLREYALRGETLERLKALPAEALERWSRRSAGEGLSGISPSGVAELVERALAGLDNEELRRRLAQGVERWAERQQARTLGEVAQRVLGLGEQELTELASVRVLEYLSRPEASQALAAEVVAFSRRFLEEHRGESLRGLLRIDEATQRRVGAYLSRQLLRILDERIPALIEGFDIRELVVAKVNNLDVAQVEQLLLMVIARQLKWINIFGAILGAIIGLTQLLLRLVR